MQILSDHSERLAALDPSQSFIVQAPAGSGKTELLIQRYLVLLARVKNPEEVLAITFTRKAAAEMRDRVLEALEYAKLKEPPSSPHQYQTFELAQAVLMSDAKFQWSLCENPNRLRIQTIDSLCASVTRQLPILSRFGSQPAITENAEKLYACAAQETLLTLENNMPWSNALGDLLLHLDNDYAKVEKLFCDMLACRDQWLFHVSNLKTNSQQRESLEKNLQQCIFETQNQLSNLFPHHLKTELITLIRFAADQLKINQSDSFITHCLDLTTFPDISYHSKKQWEGIAELLLKKDNQWRENVDKRNGFPADKNLHSKEMKQRFLSLLSALKENDKLLNKLINCRTLPPPTYTDTQWKILTVLLELLPILTAQLHVLFQETNTVDYIEVTQSALLALGEIDSPSELALRLDYTLQHILLDEFQDTANIQLRLLEKLTAGWQAHDGRTLFLVGDPMQSIYRFRKAEVGLFLQVKEHGIGNIQLTPLILRINFRSTENIVSWFNEIFSSLMPKEQDIRSGSIPFTSSTTSKNKSQDSAVHCMSLLNAEKSQEAIHIASLIQEIRSKNPEDTIAILVRARSHLSEILPQLEKEDIPYRAIEIESLHHRMIIQDLLALTRALLNPVDRVAWLAVLRAPWCGLTLTDLHTLVGNTFSEIILEQLQNTDALAFSDHTKKRLENIVSILNDAFANRGRQSLSTWIENVWYALGGPACVNVASDLKDAELFFKFLSQRENDSGAIDMISFEKQLSALYSVSQTSEKNCVEVMTLHKAKGLEFDHVILPGLDRNIAADQSQLLLYEELPDVYGNMNLLLAPIKASSDERDPIYHFLRSEEKKRAENEIIRLLYVAVTRAKKSLYLSAILTSDNNIIESPASNSLLGFLWPKLENDFVKAIIITDDVKNKEKKIENQNSLLARLANDWVNPQMDFQTPPTKQDTSLFSVKLTSHNPLQKYIGTIAHQLLQMICLQEIKTWDDKLIQLQKSWMKNQLISQGLTTKEMEWIAIKIETAIKNILDDPQGRWILNQNHRDSRTEYPLTAQLETEIVSVIIDRTFIDEKGTRWIIDYKIVEPSTENKELFLDKEVEIYKVQLERYAKILVQTESHPIKLGLYFPLLQAWREWDY
jgi:ATP-dependent helicase/nuclease subunit A